jgi:hypothetical protein
MIATSYMLLLIVIELSKLSKACRTKSGAAAAALQNVTVVLRTFLWLAFWSAPVLRRFVFFRLGTDAACPPLLC